MNRSVPRAAATAVAWLAVALAGAPARAAPATSGLVPPAPEGLGRSATGPVPVDIEADHMELDRKANVAHFEGNVRARQGDLSLRCARLTATFSPTGAVLSLRLAGDVRLDAPDLTARAAEATFSHAAGEFTLTGAPEVTRGAHRLAGERIRLFPETNRIVVEKARGTVLLPPLRPAAFPKPPVDGR